MRRRRKRRRKKRWRRMFVLLLLYAHRHRSVLGAAGHIMLTPANQLMEE
jgi:hypothetical protein